METSTDGGSTFDVGASDYTWAVQRTPETGTATGEGDADDTELQLTGADEVGFAANENANFKVSIFNPEVAEFTTIYWIGSFRRATGVFSTITGSGDRQSAADVDAVRFHWAAGDWIAQGKIQFLGITQ